MDNTLNQEQKQSGAQKQHADDYEKEINPVEKPQVLMEYPGPGKENEQDIFLLLRPETNNYKIESSLLSVFRYSPEYNKSLWIRYLANLSGKFMVKSKMLLHHYELRVFFAKHGTCKFSKKMKQDFEKFFSKKFENCEILGSFKALRRLGINKDILFQKSQEKKESLRTNGQDIQIILDKDQKEVFVINADVPELLSRDYQRENCAVVMFRTSLDYCAFNKFVEKVYVKLVEEGLLQKKEKDEAYAEGSKRAFHYSKGPFEQVRDAYEYLYTEDGNRVDVEKLTFARFLEEKNISPKTLELFLRNPIVQFSFDNHKTHEENSLYEATLGKTYEEAYQILCCIESQNITYEKKVIL